MSGHLDLVWLLVVNKFDPNIYQDGKSQTQKVYKAGLYEMARVLLDDGPIPLT